MVEIRWTNQSLEDIENIAEYIANDSLRYAEIQVQDFFDSVMHLENQPLSGRVVPEMENDKIREIIVGLYRVIYHVKTSNQIDILTVHHSKRILVSKLR